MTRIHIHHGEELTRNNNLKQFSGDSIPSVHSQASSLINFDVNSENLRKSTSINLIKTLKVRSRSAVKPRL